MELLFFNGQYNATLKNKIFNRSLIAGAKRNELNFVRKTLWIKKLKENFGRGNSMMLK